MTSSPNAGGRSGGDSANNAPPETPAPGAHRPELSVVVPAHDEADNLPSLLEEIRTALAGRMTYEVIVVDDGSSDGSPQLLRDISKGFPELRVLRHRVCHGQSAALLSGVRAAGAPWIATLDGDGQNDPADIPKLWRMLADPGRRNELQLIAGHRVRRRDAWLKRVSSRIANGVRGRLLGDRTPDTGCGLKLFDRAAVLAVPHFDHFHRFLPALIQRGGGRVVSVEVGHRPRSGGRSHYGVRNRLWIGIVDLVGVMWLQRRAVRPTPVERERHED